MTTTLRKFDSLHALVQYVMPAHDNAESRNSARDSWAGGSWDEAIRLATHGWADGATQAKRLLEKITDHAPQEYSPIHTQHDMTGAYVDVGAYVEGVPECMIDFAPDIRPKRFVRILIASTFSSFIKAQQVLARGVAIAAAIDKLETRGVRCEIDAILTTQAQNGTNDKLSVMVTIKNAHEALSLEKLVYVAAHPTFLRRIGLSAYEQESATMRSQFGCMTERGYGGAVNESDKDIPAGTIYFPIPNLDSPEDIALALDAVNAIVEKASAADAA